MSKTSRVAYLGTAALAIIALSACGDDAGIGPGTSGSFVGAFAASDGSGSESGVFRASWNSPATGSIELTTGSTINLTGEFIAGEFPPSGSLTLSGGGYTFGGDTYNGYLRGDYTGPNGAGRFVAFPGDAGETVAVFCGDYTGSSFGEWLIVRSGSDLLGVATKEDGWNFELTGSIGTNNSVNLTFIFAPRSGGGVSGSATGALTSSTTMSGTWLVPDSGAPGSGNWSGSTTQC